MTGTILIVLASLFILVGMVVILASFFYMHYPINLISAAAGFVSITVGLSMGCGYILYARQENLIQQGYSSDEAMCISAPKLYYKECQSVAINNPLSASE